MHNTPVSSRKRKRRKLKDSDLSDLLSPDSPLFHPKRKSGDLLSVSGSLLENSLVSPATPKGTVWRGVLKMYRNHPVENLVHKTKTIKFKTLWNNTALQSVSTSAGETKKRGEMASPQFTFLTSKASQMEWHVQTIWFSNWNFWFSHLNGKLLRAALFKAGLR